MLRNPVSAASRFANRRGSSQAGASAAASATRRGRHELDDDESDDEAPPKRYLNGRITKLHNVRAEPIRDAKVVGYLVATKEVQHVVRLSLIPPIGRNQ